VNSMHTISFTEKPTSTIIESSAVSVLSTTTTVIISSVLATRDGLPTAAPEFEERHSRNWYGDFSIPKSLRRYDFEELQHACGCFGVSGLRPEVKARTSTNTCIDFSIPTVTVTRTRKTINLTLTTS